MGDRVQVSLSNERWLRAGMTDFGPWTVVACKCGLCERGEHLAVAQTVPGCGFRHIRKESLIHAV